MPYIYQYLADKVCVGSVGLSSIKNVYRRSQRAQYLAPTRLAHISYSCQGNECSCLVGNFPRKESKVTSIKRIDISYSILFLYIRNK